MTTASCAERAAICRAVLAVASLRRAGAVAGAVAVTELVAPAAAAATISNYPFYTSVGFGVDIPQISVWLQKARDPPILPSRDLYRFAHAAWRSGVLRHRPIRRAAARVADELSRAGYSGGFTLYTKPSSYLEELDHPLQVLDAGEARARRVHDRRQYRRPVLRAVTRSVPYKLPNPMYFLP